MSAPTGRAASRYSMGNKLKGKALEVAKRVQYKHRPPFYQYQMDLMVDEKKRLKASEYPFLPGDRVINVREDSPDYLKVGKIHSWFAEGNKVSVEGMGEKETLVIPPQIWSEGQERPVIEQPRPIDYRDLKLVVKMVADDASGAEEDVICHSLELSGTYYDEDYNKVLPIRRLKHNTSVRIPWPRPETPPVANERATQREEVEEQTYFPSSLFDRPVPLAALSQIANPYSRYRYRRTVTAQDIKLATAPKMPLSESKLAYHKERAQLREKRSESVLTREMLDHIDAEIKKGLEHRQELEKKNLEQYR